MPELSMTKTVFIAAPKEAVWAYLTEKDKLAEWFYPGASDLGGTGEYNLYRKETIGEGDPLCWGEITEWSPPSRLVYSFTIEPLGGHMTTVEWTLDSTAGGTRLTMLHRDLPENAEAFGLLSSLESGWDRHFGSLREAMKAG